MKFKTLKRISPVDKKYDEYASMGTEGEMYTHQHPQWLGEGATIEGLKKICDDEDIDIDWNNYKIVEIEYFEGNISADIRNKLTPAFNLISLLNLYFKETDESKKYQLKRIIKKEMARSKKNIKYIDQLL